MGEVAVTVFGLAGLLALIAFLPPLAQRLGLPYTVLLALLGVALGGAIGLELAAPRPGRMGVASDFLMALGGIGITADAFLTIFLPVLLFEAALAINLRILVDDLIPVLVLAVVAVVVTTLVAGLAVWLASPLGLAACLMLAAIVSTTDPSAVVAIFREVGAPQRLSALVEGESLLNDAAAIALFGVLAAIVAGLQAPDPAVIAAGFLWDLVGGVALGWLAARLAGALLGRPGDNRAGEISLSLALPYLAYVLGEHYLAVSGVVAVATAGLVIGDHGRIRLPPADWQAITLVWRQLGFWASSLVFILASMLVPKFLEGTSLQDLALIAVLAAGATAARALVLYGLLPALTALGLAQRIERSYRLVILWGGLRGAVTLALALAVGESPQMPQEVTRAVTVLATGYVLFTLFVQATTLRALLRRLGLDRLSPFDQLTRQRVMELALEEILDRLAHAAQAYRIDTATTRAVETVYRRRLERVSGSLDGAGIGDEAQLAIALATLASREGEIYREQLQESLIAPRLAGVLADQAMALLDGARSSGIEGYLRAAAAQTGFAWTIRVPLVLHRRLRLQRPLARVLAERFELLVVRGMVLRELDGFLRDRLWPLLGPVLGARLEEVVEARQAANEQALAALQLQFPAYGRELGARHLGRAALRLEDRAYRRLHHEFLIGPEVYRDLMGELRARRQALRRAPRLDLGMAVEDLLRRVPLFRELEPARITRIRALMRPRLALPGERLITRGERGDRMYVIASGAVEVRLHGGPVRLGTGEVFGEVALLTRRPRMADVVAIGYCQLLTLDGAAFRRFLRGDPALKAEIQAIARARLRPPGAPA
jgi:monovalent cation:H+ antiporter, CPA1 family